MSDQKTMMMLGNAAIARGAYEAGVKVSAAYPGTPSTEISENLVQYKDELYCERIELSEDECAELDSRIAGLLELVHNGSSARENNVTVSVTHFVPCTDKENDAYGCRGQYAETKGVLNGIDTVRRMITVGGEKIVFSDILEIKEITE